ncbi:LOW QUALITY PROTEIN: dynein regulatory complex protein 1-like [Lycodopsis pacificus]
MKKRAVRLHTEIGNIHTQSSSENKQFTNKIQHLPVEYKHKIQQYEQIQKNIKHFAVADARQFEEMWLMIDAEVKQLVERVLVIDSLICKEHLGLAWERTPLEFMELSGTIQPQKQARMPPARLCHTGQNLQCSQRMMDLSVGPRPETDIESMDEEMYKEGKTVQSESGAEVEEVLETLKKVMELLCDEAGFLMEDKLLNLLAPLEKEEQTVVKLGSLLCDVCVELGESSNKEEDVETKSMTHLSSELINPNHILPALKSFLEQHMRSRESSASQNHSFHVEAWDTPENEAYWESMGNIISEDKVKLWDATENTLKQYLSISSQRCCNPNSTWNQQNWDSVRNL